MKIHVFGNHYLIESRFSIEQIAKVAAHRPQALKLRRAPEPGAPSETVFQIALGCTDGFNSVALTFHENSATSGKAVLTLPLPPHQQGQLREALVESVGVRIAQADTIEGQIETALTEIAGEEAAVSSYITIDGEAPAQPAPQPIFGTGTVPCAAT